MNNTNGLKLGIYGVKATKIKRLPDAVVVGCPSLQAAFRLSFSQALVKRNDDEWASALGESTGAFNLILNNDLVCQKKEKAGLKCRKRHIPDHWFTTVPQLTGNKAVSQWLDLFPERQSLLNEIEKQKNRLKQLEMEIR